jgi:cell division protein FtsZ
MLGFSDIKQSQSDTPIIKVIGIGGGGGNAINRMVTMMDAQVVEFIAANTDLQDLRNSAATYKLQLGINCTKGLGAGAKPNVGREAAIENADLIREFASGADMVFITAGMGGGTGTGGAPIVAQIAREADTLTVGVVTLPFKFEGMQRRKNADQGVQELKDHVDTLIVIPNDNLLEMVTQRTSMVEAFNLADDVLRQAIQGISDLITNEGIINLDFADVKTVMQNGGKAVMGIGAATGENRAIAAAERAISSPLLNDCEITGSWGVLVNIVGGNSLTLHEVNEAASFIQGQADEEATIIWGASIHPDQGEQIQITVIATGFGKEEISSEMAQQTVSVPPYKSMDAPLSNSLSKKQEETVLAAEQSTKEGKSKKDKLKKIDSEYPKVATESDEMRTPQYLKNSENAPQNAKNLFPSTPDSNSGGRTLTTEKNVASLSKEINEDSSSKESQSEDKKIAAKTPTVDVEESPRFPDWAWRKRHRHDFTSDLDIPTFIRRRAKKLGKDFR